SLDTYEQALGLAREVDDIYGEALMLVNVGARLHATDEDEEAVEVLEHALRLADQLGASGGHLRSRGEAVLAEIEQGRAPVTPMRQRRRRSDAPGDWNGGSGYPPGAREQGYNGPVASAR